MERPKSRASERRWPIAIQFMLGTAGLAVTAAGIYELARGALPPSPVAAMNQQVEREMQVDTQPAEVEAREAWRQEQLAAIRRYREEKAKRQDDLMRRGARCIDGVWIVKEGNAISSHGRCSQ